MPSRLLPALLLAAISAAAHAQNLIPTSRSATQSVTIGDVFTGPHETRTFSAFTPTHDFINLYDAGGTIPQSEGSTLLDATPTSNGLTLAIRGHAQRGPYPYDGAPGCYAIVQSNDQWNFTISQPTCFSVDATYSLAASPHGEIGNQGVQLGIGGNGAAIYLSDGSYTSLVRLTGSDFAARQLHITGTLTAGSYYMTIAGYAGENGAPMETSFNHSIRLTLANCCGSADFNGDGDTGTDQDIEAFFRCLAGDCCPTCGTADFNNDGDIGTDQDIESFFRVLAGAAC